ncbi:MAG: hypothetical protein ACO2PL_19700 [Armatimonadota bacterium]
MKKSRKWWLTFFVSILLGIWGASVIAQFPCWYLCPNSYPTDREKCLDCCDRRCPNNIALTKCYNNCPP